MNGHDWDKVVVLITANWPHQLPPDEALAKWGQDLNGEEVEDVLIAVETLYRDGREFPPNGAQILRRVGELRRNDPDPGEAWDIAMHQRPHDLVYERTEAMDWLEERSPAVAEALRRFGIDEFVHVTHDTVGTARAQFRRIYEGVLTDRERGYTRHSIEDGIERMRALKKPDYAGSLPAGGGEETSQ